jgi:hypothetical protein
MYQGAVGTSDENRGRKISYKRTFKKEMNKCRHPRQFIYLNVEYLVEGNL